MTNQVVLGITTMGAGEEIPGSIFKDIMDKCVSRFKKIIIIDGGDQTSANSARYYNDLISRNNHHVVGTYNSWNGSLKEQYDMLVTYLEDGDWWFMLDDDEMPSDELLNLVQIMQNNLDKGLHALDGIAPADTNTILTPRVTFFNEDTNVFFAGELFPDTDEGKPGCAGPRAHIFLYNKGLKMMHSKAGRHVVPYHEGGNRVYAKSCYHMHIKVPANYVLNDCLKAMLDHDIKDPIIEREFLYALETMGIKKQWEFSAVTSTLLPSKELKDFAFKYREHGAPEGRVFIWLYNILYPALNPISTEDWTKSLRKVLNPDWRRTYLQNKNNPIDPRVRFKPNYISKYLTGDGKITL